MVLFNRRRIKQLPSSRINTDVAMQNGISIQDTFRSSEPIFCGVGMLSMSLFHTSTLLSRGPGRIRIRHYLPPGQQNHREPTKNERWRSPNNLESVMCKIFEFPILDFWKVDEQFVLCCCFFLGGDVQPKATKVDMC